jgi:hypothetical protein
MRGHIDSWTTCHHDELLETSMSGELLVNIVAKELGQDLQT